MLALVAVHSHRAALARRASDPSLFGALRRLEADGLVFRRRDLYRLTRRGEHELALTRAVAQLVIRSHAA